MQSVFQDTALIIAGHGSTVNKDSSQPLRQIAAQIRSLGMFGQVLETFLKEEPSIAETMAAVSKPKAVIIPFFISEGYFSGTVVPEAFGFPQGGEHFSRPHSAFGVQQFIYAKPVGTHPAMTGILLRLAEGVVKNHPFPRAPKTSDITLFIAGHGTPQDARSKESVEHQASAIAGMGRYAKVQALYLEEEPKIENFHLLAPTKNVVMVPFFISNGMHTAEDIPRLLGETERVIRTRLEARIPTWRNPSEKKGKLIWYSHSIGLDPLLAEVVIARANEALELCAREDPLKVSPDFSSGVSPPKKQAHS